MAGSIGLLLVAVAGSLSLLTFLFARPLTTLLYPGFFRRAFYADGGPPPDPGLARVGQWVDHLFARFTTAIGGLSYRAWPPWWGRGRRW